MAIGLVLGGSTLAIAGAQVVSKNAGDDAPGRAISAQARTDDDHPGRALGHAKQNAREGHPINHGYYVSRAAHCEDVNDPESGVQFAAPADCATDEAAHDRYVRRVAESQAGKPNLDADEG
jgi:hypothetical protein